MNSAARVTDARMVKVDNDEEFTAFYSVAIRRAARHAYLLYRNREEAEDAAQEALAVAYCQWSTKLANLEESERWKFVMKVMSNKWKSRLRREYVRRKAMILLYPRHRRSESIIHVDTQAEAREVIRAIRDLPAQQRTVALLHWRDEIPLHEIAEILNMDPSTARTHLSRARNTLMKRLGDTENLVQGATRNA